MHGIKEEKEDRDAKDRQNANQTKTNKEYILSVIVWQWQKMEPHITVTDRCDR